MNHLAVFVFTLFSIFIFSSCSDSNADENRTVVIDKVKTEVSKKKVADQKASELLISDNALGGIATGDLISNHSAILTKTTLKTGEGEFEAYKITNDIHGEVGYLLPDPRNTKLVGNIFISNPKLTTKDGFHVGSTLADLLQKNPELEIHGSESEGRTNAMIGNHYFLIDSPNFTYEIDKSKIPKTAKVLEIMIKS